MHLLDERFGFWGGDDRGFLKEVVKTYLMAPMSLPNSPIFFPVIYSPWLNQPDALCPSPAVHR
jgi:hypothetical protein